MNYRKPEEVGVSSANILKFIKTLEENHLATHDVILSRGNDIFFETYWKPFDKDFLHRMYSVTKSFVAIAIGFLEQDGMIDLDDKIIKYFAKELEHQTDENMRNQTIRHMLMMSTAKGSQGSWFKAGIDDRVQFYFDNQRTDSRPSGMLFEYDSTGSFVLGALVERVTGKSLIAYLREKLFDKIGVSEGAHFLKCPGGHSWGDSALLCTPMDLWLTARFMLNKGKWNGEQILNEKFAVEATSNLIDTGLSGEYLQNTLGYGYLFWRTYRNSFFFNGMGSQYAVCVPDKDIIMVYNADNQGLANQTRLIFDKFFELIVEDAADEALPEDKDAWDALAAYCKDLKLYTVPGAVHNEAIEKMVNGVTYRMAPNPMGITSMKFSFDGDKGLWEYVNEQGPKSLAFGLGYNEFGHFMQEGYSDEVGSKRTKGHFYKCAASAAWQETGALRMKLQIIDKYFGVMNMSVSFREKELTLFMSKTAEDFLDEYQGFATGVMEA